MAIVDADVIETAIAAVVVATEIATNATPVAEIAVAIETVIGDNKVDRSKMPNLLLRTSVVTSVRTRVNVADVRTVAATSRVAKTVVARMDAVVIAQSAVRAMPNAPPHRHPLPLKMPRSLRALRRSRRRAVARPRARTPLRALRPQTALSRTVRAAPVAAVVVVAVADAAAACVICPPAQPRATMPQGWMPRWAISLTRATRRVNRNRCRIRPLPRLHRAARKSLSSCPRRRKTRPASAGRG